jgi:hypothetical protein
MDTRSESAIPHAFLDERSLLRFGLVGGVLLFVVLTGCAVWVLPFGVFAQLCLVSHTVVGVVAVAAFAIWQLSHWLAGRTLPRTFRKICAYIGFWLLAVSAITGLIVSWQATVGRYVSQLWHYLHLWTGIIALPFVAYHVWPVAAPAEIGSRGETAPLPVRSEFRRHTWKAAAAVAVLLFAVCAGLAMYHARLQQTADRWRSVGFSDFQPSMVDRGDASKSGECGPGGGDGDMGGTGG